MDCGTHYEYVLVYVDDLMCIGTHPECFFQTLTETYNFKLKGAGEPSYQLGGGFVRDSEDTLAWGAASYVNKMVTNYEVMFGEKPTKYSSPMIPKDHLELNLTQSWMKILSSNTSALLAHCNV
jgi:hypothetical protein